MSKVSPGSYLKAFMDPQLLGYLKTFINANMTSDPISSSDIIAFIRVELMFVILQGKNNVKTATIDDVAITLPLHSLNSSLLSFLF